MSVLLPVLNASTIFITPLSYVIAFSFRDVLKKPPCYEIGNFMSHPIQYPKIEFYKLGLAFQQFSLDPDPC